MGWFQWVALISILFIAILSGFFPLFRPKRGQQEIVFPLGEAFASGLFLAFSLVIMLPGGSHLLTTVWPDISFPVSSFLALAAMIALLAISHIANRATTKSQIDPAQSGNTMVAIIMTLMIAVPSFLMGTALGVSEPASALLIFIAVVAHKGSAGFALALCLRRSRLSQAQALLVYCLFLFATPIGILVGGEIHHHLQGHTMMVVKGVVLSLAAGVFLFMGTLHELKHAPLLVDCCTPKGFIAMLFGLLLTVGVRLVLGLAHAGHPPHM